MVRRNVPRMQLGVAFLQERHLHLKSLLWLFYIPLKHLPLQCLFHMHNLTCNSSKLVGELVRSFSLKDLRFVGQRRFCPHRILCPFCIYIYSLPSHSTHNPRRPSMLSPSPPPLCPNPLCPNPLCHSLPCPRPLHRPSPPIYPSLHPTYLCRSYLYLLYHILPLPWLF